jgi:adenylate cyclase
VLLRHDALIDKLIDDEAMALFIPGVAGPDYRRKAVSAAIDLLHAVGYGSAGGPWLAVGIGVNAGHAYVGNVGSAVVDFTALGDPINVAARLQAAAGGGQLVVAEALHGDLPALLPHARRDVMDVRGREATVPVLIAQPQAGSSTQLARRRPNRLIASRDSDDRRLSSMLLGCQSLGHRLDVFARIATS